MWMRAATVLVVLSATTAHARSFSEHTAPALEQARSGTLEVGALGPAFRFDTLRVTIDADAVAHVGRPGDVPRVPAGCCSYLHREHGRQRHLDRRRGDPDDE